MLEAESWLGLAKSNLTNLLTSSSYRSPVRCRFLNANQPGMVGIQNVIKRNTKVAEIAMPASIPAAVKPAAIAASTAPKPPGVGAACPITEPARYTKAIAAIDASVVKARTAVIKQAQYAKSALATCSA